MNHELISNEGSHRLLLIFAGWGMDAGVFAGLARPGYDVMVVWDYRSFYIDWTCVETYDEVCLLAWSMGVFAASQTTQAIDYKITKRVAVNGTLWPINDNYGIPEDIFYGTLNGLCERSIAKFNRRMCNIREDFELFSAHAPQRQVDELRDELQAVADRLLLATPSQARWDLAVISRHDRIFPFYNQQRAWTAPPSGARATAIKVLDSGHYVDFQHLVDMLFIDKSTMRSRFARGMATYADNSTVQAEVVARLMSGVLDEVPASKWRQFKGDVIEIGSGTGHLSRRIAELMPEANITLWDIAADAPEGLERCRFVSCDAELRIRSLAAQSVDCIFSASTVQWFNSPERFIEECERVLRPGGQMFLSTFVTGNLRQIAALTGASLPMMSAEQWYAMCEKYFEVRSLKAYERDIDFATPLDALRHLKLTGVNSLGNASGTGTRELLRRFPMMLDGRYHLTYCPIIIILRKR